MTDAVTAMSYVIDAQTHGSPPISYAECWRVFSSEPVGGTNAVESVLNSTTSGVPVAWGKFFGVWLQCASSGTANIKVELLQSYDDTAANYVIPNVDGTVVASHSGTDPAVYLASPTPMPYLRIRVTGVGSNHASTTVTLYLFIQA